MPFAVTAYHYRWYNDDGSEAANTAAANEDTTKSLTVNADANIILRYGVQESGSGSSNGATTDDYQLQYKLNAGSFTNVTSSSDPGVQTVCYWGTKQYVRVAVTVTGSPATGGPLSAIAVSGSARVLPAT